ncbi:hypothetical protein DF223_06015 [Mycetocola zhujimingii]|uniref:O-antigen ligase-related domain-containing protein n=1 Tax=Mycetocola zhujimingii TaxID=2079792 RepID=A0A2U1TFB2_9MICO|nr:hypothetical protein DF223_06015 [Mycetocola zhujimingii]
MPSLASTGLFASVWVLCLGLVALFFSLRGRNDTAIALLIVSTSYSQVPLGPINGTIFVLGAAIVGSSLWNLTRGGGPKLEPKSLLAYAGGICTLIVSVVNPPATAAGQFVALEVTVVLFAAGLILGMPKSPFVARRSESLALQAIIGLAIFASMAAYYEIQSSESFILDRQLSSVFGGSNYVAALAAVAVVILLSLLVSNKLRFVTAIVCVAPLLLLISSATSRTSTLVLVAVSAAVLFRSKPSKRLLYGLSAIVVIAVSWEMLFSGVIQRLNSGPLETLLADRILIWGETWRVFAQSPIFGTLPGHLADELSVNGLTNYSHNIVLSILAQGGLLGAIFIAAITPWKAFRISAPAGAAFVVLMLVSLFEPVVETQRLGIIALCTAYAVTHVYSDKKVVKID